MPSSPDLAIRNATATIADLKAMAAAVRQIVPGHPALTFSVGDGQAVFLGPGLFVNRLLGLGLHAAVRVDHLENFEQRCFELGHRPEIDVSSHADPELVSLLRSRGYERDDEVVALCRPTSDPVVPLQHRVEVVTAETLDEWCNGTAAGWGHDGTDRRSGSDLYGQAAFVAQDPGLLLARPIGTTEVSGCAALAIVGDTAILGGMSTMPAHRRTGVQTTMISARLQMAAERGCSLACTQADAGGDSLRNLLRHGFVEVGRIESWLGPSHSDPTR